MILPVREILKPDSVVLWAQFDPAWYLQRYGRDCGSLANLDTARALDFYLDEGQHIGHSPNLFFDEKWYLRSNPAVVALIKEGTFASGFSHYCEVGYRQGAPHWLFDLTTYAGLYTDLTEGALREHGCVNHYDHYLKAGVLEGRTAHHLFNSRYFHEQLENAKIAVGDRECLFGYFLRHLGGIANEPRVSPYFDPIWYRLRYPGIADEISAGTWSCALHHYLGNDDPTEFDPLEFFSEEFYLLRYTDIKAETENGRLRNGYQHFMLTGAAELRSPCASVDLRRYQIRHEQVRADIASGRVTNAFVHFLTIGRSSGLSPSPSVEEVIPEELTKRLFRKRAENMLQVHASQPLIFNCTGLPNLTVVMVLYNNFSLTLQALASLHANISDHVEIILIDSGSTDETRHINRYVKGVRVIHFRSNVGYIQGCNHAIPLASAEFVLFLNNDVDLAPGAIAAAIRRLSSDPLIGAVGGKIIRTHGLLQEAGSIVWQDGTTEGYLRDAPPTVPEANFVREVDYCSAVFLMVRTALVRSLDGFDAAYKPAYFEDADLCLRIWKAGFKVVYDPSVVIEHLEFGSSSSSLEAEKQMKCRRLIFIEQNSDKLRDHLVNNSGNLIFARSATRPFHRLLFIEDVIPLRLFGSGYTRSNDLIKTMTLMGIGVTVFPLNYRSYELARIYSDFPDTVEILYDRSIVDLPVFLKNRIGYFDAIWIARTHNLTKLRSISEIFAGHVGSRPTLVLDTEAISALRSAAEAIVLESARNFDLQQGLRDELVDAPLCDAIVAVTAIEADILRVAGLRNVSVIGHMCNVRPTPRAWGERAGILFVGAIHSMNSPNYDSLCWFVEQILPLVENELTWETRLNIVGYTAPGIDMSDFANHHRITIHGEIDNLEPFYNSNRLFVAPTRYAAGIPYKVHDAASYGLPVVATELLRYQLDWRDGQDILSAEISDPKKFAKQIVSLYRSEELWSKIREGAIGRIQTENTSDGFMSSIKGVLGIRE